MESTKVTLLLPIVFEKIFQLLKIPMIVIIIKLGWNKVLDYSLQIKNYSHLIPASRNALTSVYLSVEHKKVSWVSRTGTTIGKSRTIKNRSKQKNWVRFQRNLVSDTRKRDLKLYLFYRNDQRFLRKSGNGCYCILWYVDFISQGTEKSDDRTSKIRNKNMSTWIPRPNLKTKKILRAQHSQSEVLQNWN